MFQSMLKHTPKLACSRMRHAAVYAGAPVPFILRGSERERCDPLSIRGQTGATHLAGNTVPRPSGTSSRPLYATDDRWSSPFSTSSPVRTWQRLSMGRSLLHTFRRPFMFGAWNTTCLDWDLPQERWALLVLLHVWVAFVRWVAAGASRLRAKGWVISTFWFVLLCGWWIWSIMSGVLALTSQIYARCLC